MKQNKLFLAAAAAMMLTACSLNDSVENTEAPVLAEQTPVAFSTYLGEYGTTRAGITGSIDNTVLKQGNAGFGVFAYYSDGATYGTSSLPDFMYNQKVEWNGSAWTYSPIKYWPNETKTDGNGATSTHIDRLSFLAYAPHVNTAEFTTETTIDGVTFLTNTDASGIYGITKSSQKGDAKIAYKVAANAANSVDLLWGTAATDAAASPVNTGDTQSSVTAGKPFLDLSKQQVNGTIKFQFHHALSRFTFGTAVAAVDQPAGGGKEGVLNSSTKILIESIEVKAGDTNLATAGILNLNNTTANTPEWENKTATADGTTVFSLDANSHLNPRLVYESGTVAYNDRPDGVTITKKNLMDDENLAWMLIPATATPTLKVTITYHVLTEDASLEAGWSDVKNVITKELTSIAFAQGKSYKLNMVIGVTSVKFEAVADNWDESAEELNVDVPKNN